MNLDWTILHWIQDTLVCPALDFLMPKITALGNFGIIWILAGAVLLCTKKYRRYGVQLLIGLALGFLTGNVILKHAVARPRPCWLDTGVPLLIGVPKDYSFPSGHSAASFAAAVSIFVMHKKEGAAALILACLIAFSRLYLFVHFPTDVLAGIAVGFICAFLACLLYTSPSPRD